MPFRRGMVRDLRACLSTLAHFFQGVQAFQRELEASWMALAGVRVGMTLTKASAVAVMRVRGEGMSAWAWALQAAMSSTKRE